MGSECAVQSPHYIGCKSADISGLDPARLQIRESMFLDHVHVVDHPDQGEPVAPQLGCLRFEPPHQKLFGRMSICDQWSQVSLTVPHPGTNPGQSPTLLHDTAPTEVETAFGHVQTQAKADSIRPEQLLAVHTADLPRKIKSFQSRSGG